MADQQQQVSTQGINALRKAGNLEEALGHARRLQTDDPEDPWVVRTLFWCLHDEFKRLRDAGDTKGVAAVREEVGELKMPKEATDDVMHQCAARILGTDPVANASELSKAGKHHDAVALLRPLVQGDDLTSSLGEAYGWVLYRKLRDIGAEEPQVAAWCLDEFLACWSTDWDPNAMLFKCILIQAKLHAENWVGLVPLVEKLGLHRLKPEEFADDREDSDFEPFQDQLLTAIHKCIKKHPALQGDRPALRQLLHEWKDSFGEGEWPRYHLGRILLWVRGDTDAARVLLLKTVQRNPSDFWRWQAFAETLSGEEAKAAFSRAILCECEDSSFKVPLYQIYANLLADEGEVAAAKASLDEAMRLRQLSGKEWREPMPAWYDQTPEGGEPDVHHYAEPFAARADELLAASLPARLCVLVRPLEKANRMLFYCVGLGIRNLKFAKDKLPEPDASAIEARFEDKDDAACMVLAWKHVDVSEDLGTLETGVVGHVNTEKKLASVGTPSQEFIPLYFERWREAGELRTGDCIKVRWLRDEHDKTVVIGWERSEPAHLPGFLVPVEGRFERAPGKAFGFIKSAELEVFVAPSEADGMTDHAATKGWAMRSKDKHGRASWKLLPGS
ncbi:hypothetical protein HZ994_18130 [Akkermansiaceae bacterium]|nr:hypothetical protein HZ994_18130 [Akkermansiaceae bacterium]